MEAVDRLNWRSSGNDVVLDALLGICTMLLSGYAVACECVGVWAGWQIQAHFILHIRIAT